MSELQSDNVTSPSLFTTRSKLKLAIRNYLEACGDPYRVLDVLKIEADQLRAEIERNERRVR